MNQNHQKGPGCQESLNDGCSSTKRLKKKFFLKEVETKSSQKHVSK